MIEDKFKMLLSLNVILLLAWYQKPNLWCQAAPIGSNKTQLQPSRATELSDAKLPRGFCGLLMYDELVEKERRRILARKKQTLSDGAIDQGQDDSEVLVGDEDEGLLTWEIYKQLVPRPYRPEVPEDPQAYKDYIELSGGGRAAQESPYIENTNNAVPIRLGILYDSNLEVDLMDYNGGHMGYIRSLVYETQLYYERPEMLRELRLSLVVVAVKRLKKELPANETVHLLSLELSWRFPEDYLGFDETDLNIILLRRDIWVDWWSREQRGKLNGEATMGSFCFKPLIPHRQVVIRAHSIGQTAVVFAHELAHALNSGHDGTYPAEPCSPRNFIMSPVVGPNRLTWSACSIGQIKYHLSVTVRDCAYDPARRAKAKPMSEEFDFAPNSRNRKRLEEDKERYSLKYQCEVAFGAAARPVIDQVWKFEGSIFGTCENLWCIVGPLDFTMAGVGPALNGSSCLRLDNRQLGQCNMYQCLGARKQGP